MMEAQGHIFSYFQPLLSAVAENLSSPVDDSAGPDEGIQKTSIMVIPVQMEVDEESSTLDREQREAVWEVKTTARVRMHESTIVKAAVINGAVEAVFSGESDVCGTHEINGAKVEVEMDAVDYEISNESDQTIIASSIFVLVKYSVGYGAPGTLI